MHTHDKGSLVPESKKKPKRQAKSQIEDPLVFDGIVRPEKDEDGRPSVGFDYRRYEHLLADSDIDPDDKRKVIEAIWDIVTSFIRLGFGVHPVQQAIEAQAECGKHIDSSGAKSADPVNCKITDIVDDEGGTS